jgi:hypothetical protein
MSQAPVTADITQSDDVLVSLSTQLPFDDVVLVEEVCQSGQFGLAKIACPNMRINARLVAQVP